MYIVRIGKYVPLWYENGEINKNAYVMGYSNHIKNWGPLQKV